MSFPIRLFTIEKRYTDKSSSVQKFPHDFEGVDNSFHIVLPPRQLLLQTKGFTGHWFPYY